VLELENRPRGRRERGGGGHACKNFFQRGREGNRGRRRKREKKRVSRPSSRGRGGKKPSSNEVQTEKSRCNFVQEGGEKGGRKGGKGESKYWEPARRKIQTLFFIGEEKGKRGTADVGDENYRRKNPLKGKRENGPSEGTKRGGKTV